MNREKIQAFLALFTATFFWASAYIFVKQLLEDVSPYMILSLRFSFAAIILVFIYNKKLLKINYETVKAGIIMGIFLFGEFFTFTVYNNFALIFTYCIVYYTVAPRIPCYNEKKALIV